jgi:hypothetical protein
MPLGIGNNLIRNGGVLNPDGLSLNLQFAADKTLTARKGPTPVFTRGSTGTFVGSDGLIQTAAVNAARFDHDPITFACKGLLIEEARENFIPFSEEFNDTSWGKASTGIAAPVVTANQGTAPDGQNTADRIVFAASTAASQEGHVWKVASGDTKASGSSVTASVWLRTETGTATVYLSITEGAGGGAFTACSVTTTWTRFTVTRTLTATTFVYMEIGPDTRALGANQPTASGATALVWGAQLEAGSFATSYIPTVASSVVRSADVCSITGANFTSFYNQSEGSLYTESFTPILSGVSAIANTGSNTNQVAVLRVPEGSRFGVAVSGTYSAALDVAISVTQSIKTIGGYSSISARQATNGTLSALDTSVIVPTNLTRLNIGSSGSASSEYANGTISAIRYYRKRLSDSKLQALTA